jgi:hypothetical protein
MLVVVLPNRASSSMTFSRRPMDAAATLSV